MAAITHIYSQFNYTNKIFSVDASSLNWAPGSFFETINMVGKTGTIVVFEHSQTVTGPGGIVSWDYTPKAESVEKIPDAKGTRIRIFND